jgi:hypothetical protein
LSVAVLSFITIGVPSAWSRGMLIAMVEIAATIANVAAHRVVMWRSQVM